MTVYVDHLRPVAKRPSWPYRWAAHMLADDLAELHRVAHAIGLRREWFQEGSTPHYDVCSTKHAAALRQGAKLVDRRELVEIIQRLRAR